ncbi:MAG: ATP-grasp domain-containing protein [Acidimicrobiales bacterium]
MARVLLILPTGTYRADEYLGAAERLGVEVVVGSERAQALAAQMGERFVELPLDDPPEAARRIVAQARRDPRLGLDAVIGVDDQGLLAAALAAAELGLAHNPAAAVALTRDKAAMRTAFSAAGVPQPSYEVIAGGVADDVADAAGRLGPAVVVKPCRLSGSRGVIRADSPADARSAALRIWAILEGEGEPAGSELLVEGFVAGPEVAVEGILRGGQSEIITIFDKPDPLDGPYFEETLYVSPTRLPPHLRQAVVRATRSAVEALGLTDGPFHAELRVPGGFGSPGGGGGGGGGGGDDPGAAAGAGEVAAVLEVAARTIGGRCSKAMVLADGSSLEELVILNALGRPYPTPALKSACGVLMIPISSSGTLASVGGIDLVRSLPLITGVEITIPLGRPVRALPEGDRYLGFVFAAGENGAGVEAALREAEELLDVKVSVG